MSEPCLFPDLAPSTSYGLGCRCIGCIDGMRLVWKRKKARQRRGEPYIPIPRPIHNQEWKRRKERDKQIREGLSRVTGGGKAAG